MSFLKKRSHLIFISIIFFLISIFILKNFSQHKRSYFFTNEIIPQFSVFLLKKHHQEIQNINFSIVEKFFLSEYKFEILNYLLEEKKNLEIFFKKNLDFNDFKVETGITTHDRIFFRIIILKKKYSTNLKEDKLIEEYLERLNQRFKKKTLQIANDIDFFNNHNFNYDQ